MTYKYKLLPALKNPVKFLKNVKTRHSSELYLKGYYNPVDLDTNPFVEQLKATRNDISKSNFPIGDMVQIVVMKEGDSYWLKPVLTKPVEGQNPAKYVINWDEYIEFHQRKKFLPVPLKYLARSPSLISKMKVSSDFIKEVEQMYVKRIKELLQEAETNDATEMDEKGILLCPLNTKLNPNSNSDSYSVNISLAWQQGTLVITSDLVEKKIFIAYRANKELAYHLVRLSNFKQSIRN